MDCFFYCKISLKFITLQNNSTTKDYSISIVLFYAHFEENCEKNASPLGFFTRLVASFNSRHGLTHWRE